MIYRIDDNGERTPVDPARFGIAQPELQRAKRLDETVEIYPMRADDKAETMLGVMILAAVFLAGFIVRGLL